MKNTLINYLHIQQLRACAVEQLESMFSEPESLPELLKQCLIEVNANYAVLSADPQYDASLMEQNKYNSKYLQKRQEITNFEQFRDIIGEKQWAVGLLKWAK